MKKTMDVIQLNILDEQAIRLGLSDDLIKQAVIHLTTPPEMPDYDAEDIVGVALEIREQKG